MPWKIKIDTEAKKEYLKLDGSLSVAFLYTTAGNHRVCINHFVNTTGGSHGTGH